jgi:pimeloyl-ACP methyl ester carboxylesterase
VGVLLLAAALARPTGTEAVVGADGTPRPGSVAELVSVSIGGHDQAIMLRGNDIDAPVLLFLEGGPDGTALGSMRVSGKGLERDSWSPPGTNAAPASPQARWSRLPRSPLPRPSATRSRSASTCARGSAGPGSTYPQLQDVDFRRDVPRLEVPVYLVEGAHEAPGRAVLARQWFASLTAPGKQLVEFESSGHTPHLDEPGRFATFMADVVLAQTSRQV